MLDIGSPQFDTPSPIVGENLIRAELSTSDQARIQSTMQWAFHVISGYNDENIPPMVGLLQHTPQRIEESPKYYEKSEKVFKKSVVQSQIEEIWKQGPITSRVKLNDDLEIEPLQNNYDVVTTVIDGETIKIIYSPDCAMANIIQAAQACQKGKAVVALFGVEEAIPNHLLIITSQFPLVDSQYTPFENISHVGCRGIKNFEQSDELAGVAHEESHARFDGTLQKYYQMTGKKSSDYPWEMTLAFINEGVAVTAQQAILNIPARAVLKANFEDMHPVLKNLLREGKYDESWLYKFNKSKENRVIADPVFLADLHARLLPGAFVEYCLSKGYKFQDLMRVLLEKLNQAKPEIAEALGIEVEKVIPDHEQLMYIVMEKNEIPLSERKEHFDLEDKVYEEMGRARLNPFEILASLEGSSENQVISDFLKWIEK